MKTVPDASGIIEGDEGKSDANNTENVKDTIKDKESKFCLLFIVHFNPSKFVRCNYCFVMNEQYLNDADRFMIKFNELKQENEELQNKLSGANNTINTLSQSLQRLEQRVQELEQKVDNDDNKREEIDLELINNWVDYGGNWSKPKATKINNVVYLHGLVKNGSANTYICYLPQGWRPQRSTMFAAGQDGNTAARIDVYTAGGVYLCGNYASYLPLENIRFVVD